MSLADRRYNKLCELEDFQREPLRGYIRDIFAHELQRFGEDFPAGREYRKYWEVAMAAWSLADLGALHPASEILGVGTGTDPTAFWLTGKTRRVFATDLYLKEGEWSYSAAAAMLADPGRYWPGPWNRKRLVVQHMDARELRYEDESFDGVFSASSLEHFGTPADVRRAIEEMHRVLKPGGVLSLSTEFRLEGTEAGLPGILMFTESDLRELFLAGLDWTPASEFDLRCSQATASCEVPFSEAAADVRAHLERHGELLYHELEFSVYPHIVLREGELVWTSIHLALQRDCR